MSKKQIELLSPAKNSDFGKTAINHGADAVYIGSPKFGARIAVGNSLQDIENLVRYAHIFKAKVYVTLNTLLYDNELEEARNIIYQLYNIGVDALIIQDMGILELDLPPISLHASTQTHNYSLEKISFLEKVGFQRVILAREQSLQGIREIKLNTNIELEGFIHGALCVCFSGQCYMSFALNGRSGNRGNCSQPCRSKYNLINESGDFLVKDSHLLSLKDFNASHSLPELIEAGISSLKIEGRLKDETYLKNITAFYRKQLDSFFEGKNYAASSSGKTSLFFEPDPEKTFNRGFTEYFLHERKEKTGSPYTQKSIGKNIGNVVNSNNTYFEIQSKYTISNGDGLCFFNENNHLEGFLVNRVEGNKIFPNKKINISSGTEIFRNNDSQFEKMLLKETAERKISVNATLLDKENGFLLELKDEDGISVDEFISSELIPAQNKERALGAIKNQLSKSGNTPFIIDNISIKTSDAFHIKTSILNEIRRNAIKKLEGERISVFQPKDIFFQKNNSPYPKKDIDYRENILNEKAADFYRRHGIKNIEWGGEKQTDFTDKILMETKHCIKYQLEQCPVYFKEAKPYSETLYLENNNRKYQLIFDCKKCVMLVKTK